ncbi:cell division protein FtsQ [Acetobacter pomorum]|uniref:Cell division protein FtsQ n=1 Tax=Acetobacter pomorum TaxID=65959 RepID=A0A2G4RFJ2_9PROT|nr:cell division protein FtsQ/DivIB [Acetobacter pomorum]PHY95317.1 cell division protein FtsQ [Acetobacter pomorum]GBR46160.1 cell division protein FtsQ [Acetobacter pomorum DSM 11825]
MRSPLPPADRPSRIGLFLRRQKRLLRPIAGLLFLAILGSIGYISLKIPAVQEQIAPLRDKLLGTSALRVTSIHIDGAQLTSEQSIRDALGVEVGDPVLDFSVSDAREKLDTLPFVDHVTIERHLSGEIDVHITERLPYAVWQHQGHFELIDRQGNRVPDQGMTGKDAEAFTKLPLVVGDGANTAAASLIDILAQEPDVKSHVTAAVRVSDRRWNLTLRDGTTVLLPEGEETPAIHRLAKINASTQLLDRPVLLIDMRLPDRLTIKEKPPTSPPSSDTGNNTPDSSASPPRKADTPKPVSHPTHPAPKETKKDNPEENSDE